MYSKIAKKIFLYHLPQLPIIIMLAMFTRYMYTYVRFSNEIDSNSLLFFYRHSCGWFKGGHLVGHEYPQ